MAQSFQVRAQCNLCGSLQKSSVVLGRRLGWDRSRLRRNVCVHAEKELMGGDDSYFFEKKTVKGEEEYIYPGMQPESLEEVCNQLFPPDDTNWQEFWENDDFEDWYPKFVEAFQEAGGFDPEDPHRVPEPWEQREWLYRVTDYLKTRPDFVNFLPPTWANVKEATPDRPEKVDILNDELDRPWNPETNAADLRATVEKRKYKVKANQLWAKVRATVGKSPAINVLDGDVRFSEEEQAMFELTDQEAWDLITQDGQAAEPREVLRHVKPCNPFEISDGVEEGTLQIEELEDFLKRKGRWRETSFEIPTDQVDLDGVAYSEFVEATGSPPEAKPLE